MLSTFLKTETAWNNWFTKLKPTNITPQLYLYV